MSIKNSVQLLLLLIIYIFKRGMCQFGLQLAVTSLDVVAMVTHHQHLYS